VQADTDDLQNSANTLKSDTATIKSNESTIITNIASVKADTTSLLKPITPFSVVSGTTSTFAINSTITLLSLTGSGVLDKAILNISSTSTSITFKIIADGVSICLVNTPGSPGGGIAGIINYISTTVSAYKYPLTGSVSAVAYISRGIPFSSSLLIQMVTGSATSYGSYDIQGGTH